VRPIVREKSLDANPGSPNILVTAGSLDVVLWLNPRSDPSLAGVSGSMYAEVMDFE
jgi:hypothetical protein